MLKLIVFDCDGVMFNSKKANCLYYNHLLTHFGLAPMDADEEDYVHMSSVTDSIQHIFRRYTSPTLAEVHDFRKLCGYGPFLQYMEIEADLLEFLEITNNNYHLAISTNRTDTMIPLLKSYGLETYFGKVVTAATAKRPKPAPDGLLEILAYYSCEPKEAVFIGDSILDEQQAGSCGVPLIAFKNTNLQAAYHVNSFLEILSLSPFRKAINGPAPHQPV
jgi:phosphoglycolate phosphatase-like HAD superfamily hydrolase